MQCEVLWVPSDTVSRATCCRENERVVTVVNDDRRSNQLLEFLSVVADGEDGDVAVMFSSSVNESSTTSRVDAVDVSLVTASECGKVVQCNGSDTTTADATATALGPNASSNETVTVSVVEVVKHESTATTVRVNDACCIGGKSVERTDVIRSVSSVASTVIPTVAKVITVIPEFELSGSSSSKTGYTRLLGIYNEYKFLASGENSKQYTWKCRAELKTALQFMSRRDSSSLYVHAKNYYDQRVPNRSDVLLQYQLLASAAPKFLPGVPRRDLGNAACTTRDVIECMDLVGGWSSVGGREARTRWVTRRPIYSQLYQAALRRPWKI